MLQRVYAEMGYRFEVCPSAGRTLTLSAHQVSRFCKMYQQIMNNSID
jgi:hypothetical protein